MIIVVIISKIKISKAEIPVGKIQTFRSWMIDVVIFQNFPLKYLPHRAANGWSERRMGAVLPQHMSPFHSSASSHR